MQQIEKFLADEAATLQLGQILAGLIPQDFVIYLYGDLGAGKTTLVRGFLRGLGYSGNVKSPTYTLVEPYDIEGRSIYHFDLYRLADPEELEYAGGRDYFNQDAVCLVEWPDKGKGWLANADIIIKLEYTDKARKVTLSAQSRRGEEIIKRISGTEESRK